MDFSLPKEYQLLRKTIREFVDREVRPRASEMEAKGEMDMDLVRKLGEAGLLGVPFPQKYGGGGAGEMGYTILMEELAKACTSTSTTVGAHIGIGAMAIYLEGTPEQKEKYLTPLAKGEKIAAFALTEPGAGSDAAGIKMRAVRKGDRYILNGTKTFITNGPIADIISVLAVTDPALGARGGVTAFIVEKDMPGFSVGKHEDKMGIRASYTSELIFEDVEVPVENVLGQVGMGFIIFMKTLDLGRLTIGAASLGGAQEVLKMSLEYASMREQFGMPIAHKQQIAFEIAEMEAEIEALRSLVYRTAWLVDTGQPFTKEASACKLLGSRIASKCINRALQIHGGLGYSRHYPIERMLRDARIAEIFEGTNEIQLHVIATRLFREYGVRIRA